MLYLPAALEGLIKFRPTRQIIGAMTEEIEGYYEEKDEIRCQTLEELELKPKEEIIVAVQFDRKVEYGQHIEQYRSEIERLAVGGAEEGGYIWTGDGSDIGYVHVKNESNYGMAIGAGTWIAAAVVAAGALAATMDGHTYNLTSIQDDGKEEEDEFEEISLPTHHKFEKLKWLPLTIMKVIILYCGIGGFDMGIKDAFEQYGTSFRVVLAIDNDDRTIDVHRLTFPSILVVKHRLGESYQKTLEVISRYVPRDIWSLTYWHASPSCLEGSTANLFKQDLKACVRLTRWTLLLFRKAKPGRWTLEQIPRIARYVVRMTPYAAVMNMREYTGQTSDRKRLIAAKRILPMQKLGEKEYKNRYISPRKMLEEAYDLVPSDDLLLRNGMNYVRSAELPAFTVTSNPQRYGESNSKMQIIGHDVLLRMMDINVDDWSWGEKTGEMQKLRMGSQCVPPTFAREIAINQHNEWTEFGSLDEYGGHIQIFSGNGLHDDVLEDVVMVRENETWRAGRIAEEDEAQEIQLICLAHSMKVRWYRKSAVYQLDRRVNTEYDTIEQMYAADSARTALSHMDEQEVDQIEAYHPEWDPLDDKHVPWSPAFKLRGPGVTIGKRAMMKDTNEPCEVVRQNQNDLSVHFPRKKEIVQAKEGQLAPYDYTKSSDKTTSAVATTEPGGKRMPMRWMKRVDQLLIQNIFSNKRLYQRLKRISFPEDGAGISFVMGINCNTGVPYSCMNEPAIGKLWMFLRDSFMEADQGRAIGSKLTNVRVTIASADHRIRKHTHDLGEAICITGGIHVGGHIHTKEPDQEHITWGNPTSLDRRDGCGIGQWTGCQMWSLTYYSDYRNRQSQKFAIFMMDSVANGAIIGMNEKQEQSEVFRTEEDNEMSVDHTDHKYPPWKDVKRDERGLPEPLQPKDLGDNQALTEKMKVKRATDKELDDVMKTINVTDNPDLSEQDSKTLREMVAYCWGMFDDMLRPVDSEPVGIQFKDPRQQPIKLQPYRCNAPKLAFLKETIGEWMADGIIKPAESPWGFPVVIVPKPHNKGWRMCVDLRKLNEVIKHDSYQSPRNDDALVWLAGKKIRSTLDIKWGYHNLMLQEEAQKVMTFTTQLGSYSYVRLPFGLATAGALFQRYMNQVLDKWLWNQAIAVVDDVAIGSATVEEHMKLVVNILCTLAERGFSVKAEKMKLFVKEFVFLGHLSTPEGLMVSGTLTEAIQKMPPPTADCEDPKKRLRSFLGLASYARKFIKGFAKEVQPLNRLLEDGVEFEWTDKCQQAWDLVIKALVETKGVYAPDYSLPLYVRTDACCEGLGAYLFQLVDVEVEKVVDGKSVKRLTQEERVIEYWSRSVPKPMRHYDARRLELLAVIMGLEHFKPYIDGVTVKLDTDHRNLTFLSNVKHSSGQLARWAMRLSEYNYELRYRPGKQMEVADCLSRNAIGQELSEEEMEVIMYTALISQLEFGEYDAVNNESKQALFCVTWGKSVTKGEAEALSYEEPLGCAMPTRAQESGQNSVDEESDEEEDIEAERKARDRLMLKLSDTVTDEDLQEAYHEDEQATGIIKASYEKGDGMKDWIVRRGIIFYKDGDNWQRKYVPEALRERVMRMMHDSDFNMHAGRESTLQDLKARYYWSCMDESVKKYVQKCPWCAKAKAKVPRRAGMLQQTLHQHSGATLSMDLVGKLRKAKGRYRYILTVLDVFSHKLIAVPITGKSAVEVLDAFVQHVMLAGLLPMRVVSDNGTEFKNDLMQKFLGLFKVRFGYSIPYHPQSNPVERVHRYVNELLRIAVSRSDAIHDDWVECLPYVVFSYNKKSIPGSDITPFMLANGFQPRHPEDLERDEFICENQTFQEKLDATTRRYKLCEKAVRDANEEMKRKHKVNYDANHYDVEFKIGSKVLWHCDAKLDKLHFRWHGPYTVVSKKSDVKYIIKDELDGQTIPVSVQQIVPFYGDDAVEGDEDDVVLQKSQLSQLKLGQFVAFKRHDDVKSETVHIGEVVEVFNPHTGVVWIHHWIDLTGGISKYNDAKDVATRKLYPEYEDETGCSYVIKKGSDKLRPNSSEVKYAYSLKGQFKIEVILAQNFNLHGNKIPSDVCLKIKKKLESWNSE